MNADWFYRQNGKQVGPFSHLVLLQMIESGIVASDTEVWRPGWSEWRSAESVPGLFTPPGDDEANVPLKKKLVPAIPEPLRPDVPPPAIPETHYSMRADFTVPDVDVQSMPTAPLTPAADRGVAKFTRAAMLVVASLSAMQFGLALRLSSSGGELVDQLSPHRQGGSYEFSSLWVLVGSYFLLDQLTELISFALVIVFLVWFYRAYRLLPLRSQKTNSYSTDSAIWSWFVPFFNFVRPYLIMREMAVRTAEAYRQDVQRAQTYTAVWWATMFVSILTYMYVMVTLFNSGFNKLSDGSMPDLQPNEIDQAFAMLCIYHVANAVGASLIASQIREISLKGMNAGR